jgi:hypothetical protein
MAVALLIELPGITAEQYDAFLRELANPPAGIVLHFSGMADDGTWRVVDVWESQEAIDAFMRDRGGALLQKHSFPQPRITAFPLHEGMTAAGPIP